jgi:hypothetical protein
MDNSKKRRAAASPWRGPANNREDFVYGEDFSCA